MKVNTRHALIYLSKSDIQLYFAFAIGLDSLDQILNAHTKKKCKW